MTRDQAYEMASRQGFEGDVFFIEQDEAVGRVYSVKIELEDDNGALSFWWAEVSEVNGCECFGEWNEENERFFVEQVAMRKVGKKSRRMASKQRSDR